MTKKEIITLFKQACSSTDVVMTTHRETSVKSQFQRNVWEVDNSWLGKIRIQGVEKCHIIVFPYIRNRYEINTEIKFEITIDEYEELRSVYFGDFKENLLYLELMYGALLKNNN